MAKRWAIRLSSWKLDAEPKTSEEFGYLLSLINDESERGAVLRFIRSEDQKRALLSRLLAQSLCAQELGIPFDEVCIRRTRGRKPYCANIRKEVSNYNFNVSHEGDMVVIASERACLVGVDVCSALQIVRRRTEADLLDELSKSFRHSFASQEWKRIARAKDDTRRFQIFRTLWAAKESFVKARGDGLLFDLGRLEFDHISDNELELRIDGNKTTEWKFDLQILDEEHVACVARGPVHAVVDSVGDFIKTLQGHSDVSAALAEPRPQFSFLSVDELLPPEARARLLDIRSHYHSFQTAILTPPTSISPAGRSDNDLLSMHFDSSLNDDDETPASNNKKLTEAALEARRIATSTRFESDPFLDSPHPGMGCVLA